MSIFDFIKEPFMKSYGLFFTLFCTASIVYAQTAKDTTKAPIHVQWDNTRDKSWHADFKEIEIKSTKDSEIQKAYFISAKTKQPLLISFHTWSGNYQQIDPIAKKIKEAGWNYIHPDFRGYNNNLKSTGSEYVWSDIDDAIAYAIRNGNVDMEKIYVCGTSGGGFASLLTYMKSKYDICKFSVWVPISNLEEWYYESKGRGNKYAKEILMSTGDTVIFNSAEARKRSPILMTTPVKKRKESMLYLHTGIHDGYTGSIPITQTIAFYNKVVTDLYPSQKSCLVPQEDIMTMVVKRSHPKVSSKEMLEDRAVIYKKQCGNVVLYVFEGNHEMLIGTTFEELK
jgi:hypothetical protein